jgi:hypothetical protein
MLGFFNLFWIEVAMSQIFAIIIEIQWNYQNDINQLLLNCSAVLIIQFVIRQYHVSRHINYSMCMDMSDYI